MEVRLIELDGGIKSPMISNVNVDIEKIETSGAKLKNNPKHRVKSSRMNHSLSLPIPLPLC
jgi:hypothetical protein